MAQQPWWTRVSSPSRLHGHTQIHHTQYDSSGRVHRIPLDNTQHSSTPPAGFEPSIRTSKRPLGSALNPYTYWNVVVLHFVTVGKTVRTVLHLESGCETRQAYHYGYSWDHRIYWHRLIRDDKKKSQTIPELVKFLCENSFFFLWWMFEIFG